jgi:putative ABC transport system substrate-binding protein
MKRREFITLLGSAAAAWPLAARAQQPSRPVRIGLLTSGGDLAVSTFDALRQELNRLGYVEGRTAVLEFRSAGGDHDPARILSLAAELVRLPVDIIVTEGTQASLAAKQATSTVPIVMAVVGDPVATGLVSNLARPGGNITGFTVLAPELGTKRLDLLREAVPGLKRVGVLWNPGSAANGRLQVDAIEAAARTLDIAAEIGGADHRDTIPIALNSLAERGVSALMVIADSVFFTAHRLIVELAIEKRLPGVYPDRPFAFAGGLLFYGPDVVENFRRSARYVDRILKGTRAGELPVEQPAKFELIVNMKAAKAIGLDVPPMLLARADEVIE